MDINREMEIVRAMEGLPIPDHYYSRRERQTWDHPGCEAGMEITGTAKLLLPFPEEEVRRVIQEDPGILNGTLHHQDRQDGESEWEYSWRLIKVQENQFTFEAQEQEG